MIIQTDTVWRAGETHVLTETVQIANGATLRIEGGAIVRGGTIEAYGQLNIEGSTSQRAIINNVSLLFGNNEYSHPASISINYADISGGSILEPNGNPGYGSLQLTNSIANGVKGFYIWYPTANTDISGNIFSNSEGISIGTTGSATVSHNVFSNTTYTINGSASVVAWANYGPQVNIEYNSFVGNTSAIEVTIDGKAIGQNNWFDTGDVAKIDAKILDQSDDLSRKDFIEHSIVLSASDPSAFTGVQIGTMKSDKLTAAGNEYVYGGGSDDTLISTNGHPVLDGGNGFDTTVFAGVRSAYNVQYDAISHTGNVASMSGNLDAKLVSIEAIEFVNGTLTYDVRSAGGQVYALYEGLLGRAPETLGLEYWADQFSHGALPATLTVGFLASAEGQARLGGADNGSFVQQLYQNTLHRAGDSGGVAYWTGQLDQGSTRVDVANKFVFSAEYSNTIQLALSSGLFVPDADASAVARVYYTMLGRAPDASGLQYWTSQIQQGGSTPSSVAQAFLGTPENQAKYGSLSNNAYVNALYVNALGRHADSNGLSYWTGQLDHGGSRADLAVQLSQSPESQQVHLAQIEHAWQLS